MVAKTPVHSCWNSWEEGYPVRSEDFRVVTVLALGKAGGSREVVCISHAPLALLLVGKGSPSPTLQSKLFWPVSLARCLIYLQSCFSVGSGPVVGHIFASHPSILTICIFFFWESSMWGQEGEGGSVDWWGVFLLTLGLFTCFLSLSCRKHF